MKMQAVVNIANFAEIIFSGVCSIFLCSLSVFFCLLRSFWWLINKLIIILIMGLHSKKSVMAAWALKNKLSVKTSHAPAYLTAEMVALDPSSIAPTEPASHAGGV